MPVDEQFRAEHGGIEVVFLPISIADDRNRRVPAQGLFLGQERPPARQGNAKDGEVIRADNGGERAPRVALLAEADHGEVVGHHVGKDAVLGANVRVGGIREAAIRFGILFVLGKNLNHLLRLRVTGRSEEHGMDKTEDSRVGANAEGENDHRRDGEPGRFEKLAQSEPKILDHIQ
jgi:hypothetical protein